MKNALLFVLVCLSLNIFGQNLKEIYAAEDTAALRQYLTTHPMDDCLQGRTLLMSFVAGDKKKLVQFLLDNKANPNIICDDKRTAFMYAALYNRTEIGLLLLAAGADVDGEDYRGQNVYDMALIGESREFIEQVLLENHSCFTAIDGPYIFNNNGFEVVQMMPGNWDKPVLKTTLFDSDKIFDQPFTCYGKDGSPLFEFHLRNELPEEKPSYKMPKKLVAISDIEGEFKIFAALLKSTGVVNKELQWNFGNGHLVLLGDFFDRGTQVTECLWLIYKLEQEAATAGGKVHFILGNHEQMNLSGDLRYVQLKYFSNAIEFKRDYISLYGRNTVLGHWLRTKNLAVKIGRLFFVHGGFSPQFAVKNIDLKTLNNTGRKYIDMSDEMILRDSIATFIFDSYYGPLWYRGYFNGEVDTDLIVATQKYIHAKKTIVGHTPVENIKTLHKGRIISIDVPHALGPAHSEALLIEKGKYYSVNTKGERKEL